MFTVTASLNPVPALIFRFDKCFKFGVSVDVVLYNNRVHPAGDVLWVFVEPGNVVP